MEIKLINIDLLLQKLENKYKIKYELEWVNIGSYDFAFIHRCDYIYVTMDDYDGWDNFGGEDNDLFIDFQIHGKEQKNYKDKSKNLLFLSNSIKERYYLEYKGKKYVEYNQLKDWIIFENNINIDEVTEIATIDYSTSMDVKLTDTEIDFIMKQAIKFDMTKLIKKLDIVQEYIYNSLEDRRIYDMEFIDIKPLKIMQPKINPLNASNIGNLENDDGIFEL
jgi:hypothetical protein